MTRSCHLLHLSSSLSNQCHSYPSKHMFHLSYPRSFTSIRSPLKCLYYSSHIFLSKKPQSMLSTPCFCHTRYFEESSLSSVLQSSVSSFLSPTPITLNFSQYFKLSWTANILSSICHCQCCLCPMFPLFHHGVDSWTLLLIINKDAYWNASNVFRHVTLFF